MSDTDNNTQATGNGSDANSTGDAVAQAVKQVHPATQRVYDTLRLAVTSMPMGQRGKFPEFSDAAIEKMIQESIAAEPAKGSRAAPAEHSATCHSRPDNQPKDRKGNVIPEADYVAAQVAKVPAVLRDTPGVVAAVEADAHKQYVCDCPLAKRKPGSGDRQMPTRSGPDSVNVHRLDADGNVVETFSFSKLADGVKKAHELYPDVKDFTNYVEKIGSQSLNARKPILAAIKGKRVARAAFSADWLPAYLGETVTEPAPSA